MSQSPEVPSQAPRLRLRRIRRAAAHPRSLPLGSLAAATAMISIASASGAAPAGPEELGAVAWERDFSVAEERARNTGLPIFALFQEVPGCQTCVSFGSQVLSHPLLVEAIESEFVAVAIYNNRGGADGEVLARFGEPAWNNPIVRFLDPSGADLVPRRSGVWQPDEIGARMIAALDAAGRPVPAYLRDAVDELRTNESRQATLSMSCFWSGEACLGEIDGIQSSRAGYLDEREVVVVSFDRSKLSYEELLRAARQKGCADAVFAHGSAQLETARALFGDEARQVSGTARDAKPSDQKRSLRRSPYADLELTPRQAVQVNSALAAKRSPAKFLSPRQRQRLDSDG